MDKFSALFTKGGLSLDRLRTLCLVGEAGSLTAAANRDTTRVSLFSRQLRELESFFGTRLELAGADVIVLRPAFLRALERRLVIAWHPRQIETRAVTGRAVEALKKLVAELRSTKAR